MKEHEIPSPPELRLAGVPQKRLYLKYYFGLRKKYRLASEVAYNLRRSLSTNPIIKNEPKLPPTRVTYLPQESSLK